jgi:hypothetical protein
VFDFIPQTEENLEAEQTKTQWNIHHLWILKFQLAESAYHFQYYCWLACHMHTQAGKCLVQQSTIYTVSRRKLFHKHQHRIYARVAASKLAKLPALLLF